MSCLKKILVCASLAASMVFASAAEAQFFRTDVAEGKPASQISTGFGRGPQNAVNGRTTEPGTHTTGADAPPLWWEVDLVNTFAIEELHLFNRDDCCQDRLRDFDVSILDANRVQVWNSGILNEGGASGSANLDYYFDFINNDFRTQIGDTIQQQDMIDFGGAAKNGRFVRVEKKIAGILTLNEVEVIALSDILPRPVLEINRDTGAMTLKNNTGKTQEIVAYSMTSGVGALNQAGWKSISGNTDASGDGSVDPTSNWIVFSDPASTTDLSEGTFGEAFLDHLSSIGLTQTGGSAVAGGPWIQNPNEDVQLQLKLADGSDVNALVEFVGNNGNPFEVGDLDFDGDIDGNDWDIYRPGLLTDLSGLSQAQAYQQGDLNGDGVNDIVDFGLFKSAFEAANGMGSFESLVPEPASLTLLGLAVVGLVRRRRS